MSGNEVTDVINQICEKISVTSEFGITEFAKYIISKSIIEIIFSIIFFIILFFLFYKGKKWIKNNSDNDALDDFFLQALLYIVFFVFSFGVFLEFHSACTKLIGFMVSPTGATINYIINAFTCI